MLLCPVVLMIRGSSFYDHVWQGLCVTAVLARVELSVLAPSVGGDPGKGEQPAGEMAWAWHSEPENSIISTLIFNTGSFPGPGPCLAYFLHRC